MAFTGETPYSAASAGRIVRGVTVAVAHLPKSEQLRRKH
jgi:hypothetical protein